MFWLESKHCSKYKSEAEKQKQRHTHTRSQTGWIQCDRVRQLAEKGGEQLRLRHSAETSIKELKAKKVSGSKEERQTFIFL